jgi:RHS repeat-associated protein
LTGTYMVAWEQTIWGGSLNLQARWVLTGGTTSGSVFTVVAETNDQADVALSSGPQGTATFAAWTDGRAGDDDIHGRLIEVDGSLGNDYKLHPAAGDQVDVQVAYNADDDEYLVVWADYRSGAGNPDIFGQRVSGGGLLVGENITVTTAAYRQIEPRIAYGSGRYLVAWRHYPGASDNYYDVYGQFLYANGQPAGSVLQIANNSGALDRETPTDVVYNATSGKFLVVWQDLGNGNWDILGRHVATNGTMDTAFQISWTVSQETSAAASYNPADDEYLVVWDAGGDIAGRRLAGDGTLLGAVIDVALEEEQELAPDVAYTGAGGYTVVWFRKVDGSGSDVYGQAIASDGSLVGDNYLIAGEAQDEQNPRVVPDGSGGALVVWWRDNTGAGTGNDLYGRQLDGHGQVLESPFAILTDSDNQDQPALAGNGSGQYLLVWRDDRNGDYDVYGQLFQGALKQTVIEYAYDPLYRLIGASYTGAISATFAYDYDKVGNMRAFTETITSTTSVERFFNDANQLTTSVDASGTTTYTYDLNGNLTAISPPNAGPATAYAYDQRNLLTSATLVGQPLADYLYDGQGNRLQQVDYTGAQPIMTTYTNDIVGLSQVLVADDGTAQVVNLFGLDLIHQDDGGQTLTLLADGLGSVRGEMAGGTVQSITTYEPYGNLLAQEGTSGTVYGFTGEQEDNATGLLYLRARYYSPALKVFQSRDPWQGTGWRPETLNYYVYAGDNPVVYTDPSGRCWFLAGVDALICGGVIIIGVAIAIYAATPDPPLPPAPTWFPDDWYLYPGKWIYEACTTVLTRSETEAERLAREHVNSLPEPEQKLIDVLPLPRPTPPSGQAIAVYRELGGKKSGGVFTRPIYSPGEFRVDPDGVSTFEPAYLPGYKPYAIGFGVKFQPPKVPGTTGPLEHLPQCWATYTPPPRGHWSINCVGSTEMTKQTLSAYAREMGAILNPNWYGPEERLLP